MRVIVLWTGPDHRAFIVVVVLIADVPVETVIQLDRQSCLRGLVTHRIRRDQCSRVSGRVRHEAALSNVLVDSIGRIKRNPRVESCDRIHEKEVVFREI